MKLRLGSRKSALAQVQARWVADRLTQTNPGLEVELVWMTTSGDERPHPPPAVVPPLPVGEGKTKKDFGTPLPPGEGLGVRPGGLKALFTKEIEEALLDSLIDIAVHSLKDMAAEIPAGLCLAAVPPREDPRDAWISRQRTSFENLPKGAKVATGSVRREAQLRRLRPDLEIVPLSGNVDTRLSKLQTSDWAGMILALAGLKRLGREDVVTEILSMEQILPAVGQGALAIESRRDDSVTRQVLQSINDADSYHAVLAERAFLGLLGGSCQTPIAAHAQVSGGLLSLTGRVVSPSGEQYYQGMEAGPAEKAETLGHGLARRLLVDGADKILR